MWCVCVCRYLQFNLQNNTSSPWVKTAIETGIDVTKIYGHKMQYHTTPSLSEGSPGMHGYHGDPKMYKSLSGKWQESQARAERDGGSPGRTGVGHT